MPPVLRACSDHKRLALGRLRSGGIRANVAPPSQATKEAVMRHARTSLTVCALALSAILLGGAPAAVAAPEQIAASGTIAVVSNVVNATQQAGPNTKAAATAQVTYAGTLVGSAREDYTSIALVNGDVRLHGVGHFTGSVDGRTGTLTYVFHGDATSGMIIITGGTGDLAGAHGRLPYALNTVTGVYDYEGVVSFT
jgi:uncharacterized protein DUF3224